MANKNFKVKNSITIPEPLALTEGGTGQTSASNALNALLPVQSSANTKFLQSDGTNVSWVANVAYQRGGTESHPASPTVGDLYYNTDYNYFESYTSNGWFPIAAAPGTPTEVTATNTPTSRAYNNGRMTVAFTAPTSGGAPTSFIVTPTPTTSPSTFTGSSSPVTVTGLASSTQYTYTVAATSPYGTSAASSASAGVTATTVPQNPTINSVTSSGGNAAIITFTAGATGGSAITEYTITSSPSTTTQTTSSSPYTFTGLTLGTSYTFNMTATNANGTSTSTTSSSVTIESPDTGAMFPLGMVQVGSAGASTITFSSIPSTYKHLQIRAIARTARNEPEDYVYLRFNSDTASNYAWHNIEASGSSVVANPVTSTAQIFTIFTTTAQSSANIFGAGVIDILDYASTSKYKTVRTLTGDDKNGSGFMVFGSGLWQNTNAVSTITLTNHGATNFQQYSQFALYGIKGA